MKKVNFSIGDSIVKQNFRRELLTLSKYACHSKKAIRKHPDRCSIPDRENIRQPFFHDTDKIIHSLNYTRYIDKTQVFYLIENDNITHRVLHVQFVSKIGRVIGRSLKLNEDLIEAIALGHDIGHSPYGHNGEKYLNALCRKHNIGVFVHNAQSARFLYEIENNGNGLNLTLQVLDGILCHNGEILSKKYIPKKGKKWKDFDEEYNNSFSIEGYDKRLIPTTLEGCVVRISDVISYIGRDIEDAITLNLVKRRDLPEEAKKVLGDKNEKIINTLVVDLINNSYNKDHLCFSNKVYQALNVLKDFNYRYIYSNPQKACQDTKIEKMFNSLFKKYLDDLNNDREDSFIVKWARKTIGSEYYNRNLKERIVIDYLAEMTDDFIGKEYKNAVLPHSFGYKFKKMKISV